MPVLIPTTLDATLDALAEHPHAQLLAGGTDFMVEVNFGHRRPDVVVAIDRLAELRAWTLDPGATTVTIGAGVTYREILQSPLGDLVPALAEAARTVGSPQIRSAGTIGGNLGTCSPAGDALPVLSALDATVELASRSGRRSLSVHDYMVGVKRTARRPGELVTAVTMRLLDGWQGYAKVGVRNAMVISTASACLAVDRPASDLRIALGAVGPTVLRARGAEAWVSAAIDWSRPAVTADLAAEFGRRVAAEARPIDDHRSTAAYRRHAVAVLAGRLLSRGLAP